MTWTPRTTTAAALPLALAGALTLFAAPAGAAGAAGSDPAKASLHLSVQGDDGENVDLHLSSGWLGAMVSAATLECDGDADADSRRMMRSLREQGEGGVWKERDGDGDLVLARRSKGMLKIETEGDDGDRAYVEMPWEVAECLMLGVSPGGDLGRRIAKGDAKFRIQVDDHDGGTVRFAIE